MFGLFKAPVHSPAILKFCLLLFAAAEQVVCSVVVVFYISVNENEATGAVHLNVIVDRLQLPLLAPNLDFQKQHGAHHEAQSDHLRVLP